MKRYEVLLSVLMEVKKLLNDQTDVVWSKYGSVNEIYKEIDSLILGLKENQHSTTNDIRLMFLPTGSLQEISILNGWGEKFCDLAEKVESII